MNEKTEVTILETLLDITNQLRKLDKWIKQHEAEHAQKVESQYVYANTPPVKVKISRPGTGHCGPSSAGVGHCDA